MMAVRVFSGHDSDRLVVERVHLAATDRPCLYLRDGHEHAVVDYLDEGTCAPYRDKMGTHSLENRGPTHA